MSRTILVFLGAAGLIGLGACTTPTGEPDNRMTSAVIGGAGGAMIGQAIGGDSRSTLIGAGAGAVAGAAIGADQSAQQRAIQQRTQQQQQQQVQQQQQRQAVYW